MAYLRCFIIKTVLKPKLNNGNFAPLKLEIFNGNMGTKIKVNGNQFPLTYYTTFCSFL